MHAQSMPVAVIYIVIDCAQPSKLLFALFNSILLPAVVSRFFEDTGLKLKQLALPNCLCLILI